MKLLLATWWKLFFLLKKNIQLSLLLPYMLPAGRNRVVAFLLSTLGVLARNRYIEVLADFNNEVEERGIDWVAMGHEERDWMVAEFIIDG